MKREVGKRVRTREGRREGGQVGRRAEEEVNIRARESRRAGYHNQESRREGAAGAAT